MLPWKRYQVAIILQMFVFVLNGYLCTCMHAQDERPFTAEEESKLQGALRLEAKELELVLDATTFILQQAAYHLTKPSLLKTHLLAIDLDEEKVHACVLCGTCDGCDGCACVCV